LIRFLDQVDRVKFAPERADNHHEAIQEALSTWEPRVATLQSQLRLKPQGRSRRKAAGPRSADSNSGKSGDNRIGQGRVMAGHFGWSNSGPPAAPPR
jgi:hypothetical protein